MPKKKSIRAEDITEKDILSLYEGVLPLLYDNPKGMNLTTKLNKCLLKFLWYDFFHYTMSDEDMPLYAKGNRPIFYTCGKFGTGKRYSDISMISIANHDPDAEFKKVVEDSYKNITKLYTQAHPKHREFHYYRLQSKMPPRVSIGFFKNKDEKNDTSFTENEKQIFELFAPHIFLILRTVLNPAFRTSTFQYFDMHTKICLKIERAYKLSSTESKFLTEILFGYSNEEIAKRNFVSRATVKKHLRGIFKKTKTKNRIDFIGKFFTSPTRVNLE